MSNPSVEISRQNAPSVIPAMGARTSIDSSPILLQLRNPDELSYDP